MSTCGNVVERVSNVPPHNVITHLVNGCACGRVDCSVYCKRASITLFRTLTKFNLIVCAVFLLAVSFWLFAYCQFYVLNVQCGTWALSHIYIAIVWTVINIYIYLYTNIHWLIQILSVFVHLYVGNYHRNNIKSNRVYLKHFCMFLVSICRVSLF